MNDVYAVAAVVPSDATRWSESVIAPEPWVQDALCIEVDPALFFPIGKGNHQSLNAKKVCAGCDVTTQCLEYALRTRQEHGIWGGTSPADRAAIRRLKGDRT